MPSVKPENINIPGQVVAQNRRLFILRLRAAGATYEKCAQAAHEHFGTENLPRGYDRRNAYQDCRREIEKLKSETQEAADEVRSLELQRLDELQASLWSRALGRPARGRRGSDTYEPERPPDYKAVDRILSIMDRRARYHGLYDAERYAEQNVTVKILGGFDPAKLLVGPATEAPYTVVEDKEPEQLPEARGE